MFISLNSYWGGHPVRLVRLTFRGILVSKAGSHIRLSTPKISDIIKTSINYWFLVMPVRARARLSIQWL